MELKDYLLLALSVGLVVSFFIGRATVNCQPFDCPDCKDCPEIPSCPDIVCPLNECPNVICPEIPVCETTVCPDCICSCGTETTTTTEGQEFLAGQQTPEQQVLIEAGKCSLVERWFDGRNTWYYKC